MPNEYDQEDWRSTPCCPVHQSPLAANGSCLHCYSLESAFKLARDVTQPILSEVVEDDEEDYEQS